MTSDVRSAAGATADVAGFLARVPLFADLAEDLRLELAQRVRTEALAAGRWLLRQGDDGDSLFVVRTGRLEVLVEEDGHVRRIGVLGKGAAVGELALLLGSPRAASVRAVRDSELLRLGRPDFERLLRESPPFAVALTRVLAGHLHRRDALLADRRSQDWTVLTVVSFDQGLALQPILESLAAELQRHADVAVVGPMDGSREAEGVATPAGWGPMLERYEHHHDRTVLVADAGCAPEWREFCLRQADRTLLAGRIFAEPPPQPVCRALTGVDLLLLTDATEPEAAGWLHALHPRAHHLVPAGAGRDAALRRAARRLSRRAVGLVLSGGGARGLAHIGAYQALRDAGVVIDRVGGCSIGAFVAGMIAMGSSPEEIIARCREELVERNPFNDFTLPVVALLRAQKAEAMLRRVFGETRVEGLPLDYYAVSSELVHGRLVIHRTGELVRAVGASMAVPGLTPPVASDEGLLVDGGVLDNLPADVMAERDEGPIVVVDVMGPRHRVGQMREQDPQDRAARVLGAARERLLGAPPAAPGIAETLSRATALASWRVSQANRELADLVIVPAIPDTLRILAFSHIDRLVAAGRRAAEDALATAPRLGR